MIVFMLVLLAGCNGLPGTGSGVERTPYEVPDRLPPGITGDGEVRVKMLLSNHTAAMENRSVTIEEGRVRSNGSVHQFQAESVYQIDGRRYYAVTRYESRDDHREDPITGRVRAWTNGTVGYLETRRNNISNYQQVTLERPESPSRNERLYRLFSTLDPQLAGRELRNGSRVYVLRADISGTVLGLGSRGAGPVNNVSFVAWIRDDGMIQGYRLRYAIDEGVSRPVTVVETLRFRDLGSTEVPKPAWVDTARDATGMSDPLILRPAGGRLPVGLVANQSR
jgi:hypothetical protein